MAKVHLLDYVAGNIRSLVNAIEKCGYQVEWIRSPEDVQYAEVGVGLHITSFAIPSVQFLLWRAQVLAYMVAALDWSTMLRMQSILFLI